MKTIDELIAHYERRQTECEAEMLRIVELPEQRSVTHADHDKWIEGWRQEKVIARDTVSYLRTIKAKVSV